MNTNLPAFTAEASLWQSVQHYQQAGYTSQGYVYDIVPQQIRPPRCFSAEGGYVCCWHPFSRWSCTGVHGILSVLYGQFGGEPFSHDAIPRILIGTPSLSKATTL